MKEFHQKRIRAAASFVFGEAELTYSFRHGSSVHEHVFDYFQVARGRKHTAERDWSRLQLGLLLTVLGGFAILGQMKLIGFTAFSALWLVPGLAVLALFTFTKSHFVVFQAAGAPVWIIDDETAPGIIAEIDRRRRDRLAEIYGPLNLANAPYFEIRKIEWLVEESVFTREQADEQIARVNAAAAEKSAAAEEAADTGVHHLFAREAIAI
jgi:hypothetical protein